MKTGKVKIRVPPDAGNLPPGAIPWPPQRLCASDLTWS